MGDVGQDRVEEVAVVMAGENHGWNVMEGFEPFSQQYLRAGETYVAPVFAYHRDLGPGPQGASPRTHRSNRHLAHGHRLLRYRCTRGGLSSRL